MFCKECGKNIADNSLKCEYCGASEITETNDNEKNQNDQSNFDNHSHNSVKQYKPNKSLFIFKIIICLIGIFLGNFLLISVFSGDDLFFGLGLFGHGNSPLRDITFGADFYTEIYDVTRDAAQNTNYMVSLLKEGFEIILIMIGSFMVLFWNFLLCRTIEGKSEKNFK